MFRAGSGRGCEGDDRTRWSTPLRDLFPAVDQERRLVNIIINGKAEFTVVQCAEVAVAPAARYWTLGRVTQLPLLSIADQ